MSHVTHIPWTHIPWTQMLSTTSVQLSLSIHLSVTFCSSCMCTNPKLTNKNKNNAKTSKDKTNTPQKQTKHKTKQQSPQQITTSKTKTKNKNKQKQNKTNKNPHRPVSSSYSPVSCFGRWRSVPPSVLTDHYNGNDYWQRLKVFLHRPMLRGLSHSYLLGGQVGSRAADPRFDSRSRRDFPGLSRTTDSKIGTPVATLPGAWHYRVSAGTGWPGVSIQGLGDIESLICNFCLSVTARTTVWADPSLRYTSMLPGG